MSLSVDEMTPALEAKPLASETLAALVAEFNRDGAVKVGRLLGDEEIARLKDGIDRVFADPAARQSDNVYYDSIAARLFEYDNVFRDLAVREPMIGLIEAILGADCHLIANNIVRNPSGTAIDTYHTDDLLLFPVRADMERHDPRVTMPTFLLNAQIALTDIESDDYGPTQYVPGSHCSGRNPNDPKQPAFEGRGGKSILCRAGDLYLQHSQVWHRGAPNSSDRTRYLLQYSYGRRFVAQRFFPFLNYRMPDRVLAGADERMLRVLGKHPKAAYG